MKKLLILIIALLAIGCGTPRPYDLNKGTTYLDSNYSWFNKNKHSSFDSITLSLINAKYRSIEATVECKFSDGELFGSRKVKVAARAYKVFMIRGFSRMLKEPISCKIKSYR